MSGTGLAAVMLMIGTVMFVMCFWKQIAIFLLFVAVTVFCFGVYYIVSHNWLIRALMGIAPGHLRGIMPTMHTFGP